MTETAGLTKVTMPQLGESVTEGQISRWLKQPGDSVAKYEALVEVITDKVNAEVPSPISGTLVEINVQEGETVAVGTLICSMSSADAGPAGIAESGGEPTGGGVPPAEAVAPPPAVPAAAAPAPVAAAPAPAVAATPVPATPVAATPPGGNGRPSGRDRAGRASPAVRRLADEHDLDLGAIKGTGLGGRVTKKDVEEFVAAGGARPAAAAQPAPAATGAAPSAPPAGAVITAEGDTLVPLNAMRKAIAEHMVRSRQTSPHAWCATEVDMTGVVNLRAAERATFRETEGVDLTYVPFVIKATCESLKAHPEVNATWTAEGVLRRRAINISVAVGLEDGLILPVIHDADKLSIAGLAHKLSDVAERARAGKLMLPDVERGTFCVNNPGTYGTVLSAPIINQPQAGIMTMEAIVKRPVVLPGDAIGIRSMMFLGLSFDHRVMDGMQAAGFIQGVKRALEAMAPGMAIY